MAVNAASYYCGFAYNIMGEVITEMAEGDYLYCLSGGFRVYYNGSMAAGDGSSINCVDHGTCYKEYTIQATPNGEVSWTVDRIVDSGTRSLDGDDDEVYCLYLSVPPPGGGGTPGGGDESNHHRRHHKTVDSTEYDYAKVEKGIAYGGFIDGVWQKTAVYPPSAYIKFNNFVSKLIKQEEAGTDILVNCEPWNSFMAQVPENFTARKDVSMTLLYTLGDVRYKVTIPAGADLRGLVDENGYCGMTLIGEKFGAVPYTEPVETNETAK